MKILKFLYLILFFLSLLTPNNLVAQKNSQGKLADKPLFRDTIFDGAADPTIIWNKNEKKWFMFYTNRRANAKNETGVTWVHGTRIGIAESLDNGATWKYRDTANINYRPTVAICGGRDFEARTYQTVAIFSKCTKLKFTHFPRLMYIVC